MKEPLAGGIVPKTTFTKVQTNVKIIKVLSSLDFVRLLLQQNQLPNFHCKDLFDIKKYTLA